MPFNLHENGVFTTTWNKLYSEVFQNISDKCDHSLICTWTEVELDATGSQAGQ